MAMCNKIITFLVLMFIVSYSYAQQYTPMTAAGYQYKRAKVDSTLHIPSFCGVPNLRNSTAIQGALAMDTCGNKLYQWTHAAGWSTISTNAIDSLKRSNDSIFARKSGVWVFQYKDSVGIAITPPLQDVLTVGRNEINPNNFNLILNEPANSGDGTNVINAYNVDKDNIKAVLNINNYASEPYFQFGTFSNDLDASAVDLRGSGITFWKGNAHQLLPPANTSNYSNTLPSASGYLATSVNGQSADINGNVAISVGTGTVTDISKGYGITASPTNPITTSGTITVDTSTSGLSGKYLRLTDTSTMLSKYVPYTGATGNVNLGSNILYAESIRAKSSLYVRDEVANKNYLVMSNSSNKGNISFANQNIGQLGNVSLSVNSLSDSRNINLPDSNGTVALKDYTVNSISRTIGKDSIIYYIGYTRYAIKDSVGGSSQNGRFGNDTATIVMAKVHNDAGVTLTNGKVVAFSTSGTNSNAPSVRLANNKGDSTSANTIGFVSGTIAVNDTGWIILSGQIEKLNTSAYSNGDIIYLDSVSGNWTKTKPVAPYHMVYLGVIVKSNAGNGSIFVKCQNGYELDEIHDVQITSKQNNQVLAYSDTQKVWKNRNIYSIVDTTNLIATKTNVAAKVNISDTATMLTPYLRSNTASATYLAKSDSATYYTKYRSDTSRTNIYNAINSKQAAGTYVTSVSGTSPISSSGGITPAISISQASTSTNGYLSSTDWNTFNGKIGASDTSVFLRKTDSATYYTKYRSDTSRTNIYNALNGKQGTLTLTTTGTSGASTLVGNTLNIPQYSGGTSYTFSTGLTNTANTITNNLSTGVSGGQSVVGGTAASNSLTLSSTSNATKGKILFGTSAYDEVNNRLGIGTTSPQSNIQIEGTSTVVPILAFNTSGSLNNNQYVDFRVSNNSKFQFGYTTGTTSAQNRFFVYNNVTTTDGLRIFESTNNVTIGIASTTDAGYKLDVGGTARATQFQLSALNTAPATSTSTGTTGEIRIVNGAIYVCVATNTWQRALLTTF